MNIEFLREKYKPTKFQQFKWQLEKYSQIVKDFFNPKNEWFYEDIPNHYVENDELIKMVLFKTLVSFVEVEDGLNHFEWSESDGPVNKELIKHCYTSITLELPALKRMMDELRSQLGTDEEWKLYHDISEAYDRYEQLVCESIVKIRGVLWT